MSAVSVACLLSVITLGICFVGGHVVKPIRHCEHSSREQVTFDLGTNKYARHVASSVDPKQIREFLKTLSAERHWAGEDRDETFLADYVQQKFLEHGLDTADKVPYRVLLSYPDIKNPNTVQVLSEDNAVLLKALSQETPIDGIPTDIGPAFHGFASPGTAKGQPIYVNYGAAEDFDKLEELGVNVTGKICIARYGKIFRGNKVLNAQERGAIGVLLYLDPAEAARDGDNVFPKSFWMPGSAMQRGSVMTGNGDPLTPGYPSLDDAYRLSIEEAQNLPRIPSQPIGYDDARKILSLLGGKPVPKEWTGMLNITYRTGPFNEANSNSTLILQVNNYYKTEVINNVIGIIKGAVEPDRYVLVGNHRDAWGYGALDPSSGTAQLLELSRVIGELHKYGWTPRRTIVFCSWGAEEYGLIGSTEWVEENVGLLQNRAVAYLNVDTAVSGDTFVPSASPSLSYLLNATKLIQDLDHPGKTLYDTWKDYYNIEKKEKEEPEPGNTGSGSDNGPFNFFAGVPSVVLAWNPDKYKYNITSSYPAYHTAYETFYLYETHIDPKFNKVKMCTQLDGLLLLHLAESILLPFNFVQYGKKLQDAFDGLKSKNIIDKLKKQNISTDFLQREIINFSEVAQEWQKQVDSLKYAEPLEIRQINDKILYLERIFIKPDGLPGRPQVRHVAFAPTEFDQYAGKGFPALYDLTFDIEKLPMEEQATRWKQVKQHVSDLAIIVREASKFLRTTSDI